MFSFFKTDLKPSQKRQSHKSKSKKSQIRKFQKVKKVNLTRSDVFFTFVFLILTPFVKKTSFFFFLFC